MELLSENQIKKLNKIKDFINLILAMYITLSPILIVLVNIFSKDLVYINLLFKSFGSLYVLFLPYVIFCNALQGGFLQTVKEKLKKLPVILALALYGWILLSCMVTLTFNVFFLYFVIYICIFICIITLDEKYEGIIINTLVCTMAASCLLGMLDPKGRFLPGFTDESYPLSLQFYNPNYSGYVMALVSILNTWIMCTTKDIKKLIISILGYILLNIFLFMNGSFAPITFVFATLFLMILYVWIKEKKCPVKLIIAFFAMMPMAFIVDYFPDINKYRTCQYNYFLECIAVVDNNLGTNMLSWFNIESIAGSDGWGRADLQAAAWAEILSNFKTFLFGNGSGGNFEFIPHNSFLCLWLNYGIVATLLYYAINIYLIVKFFKIKNNIHLVGYMGSVIGYLIMMMTGDLIEYSFCFHMIILAFTFRKVEQAYQLQIKEQQEEEVKKYLAEQKATKKTARKTTGRKSSTTKSTPKKTTRSVTNKTTKSSTSTTKKKTATKPKEEVVSAS